jgi:hypothetical protein
VKSAGCGDFLHRADIRFGLARDESAAIHQAGGIRTGQEIDMNLRTITGQLIAVALIAPAAAVFAAEPSGQGGPYTGPDQAVMTTASNDEFTFVNRDSVDVSNDAMPPARDALSTVALRSRFGQCGMLTFSDSGHDTAISSNLFADPVLGGDTAFTCHTY